MYKLIMQREEVVTDTKYKYDNEAGDICGADLVDDEGNVIKTFESDNTLTLRSQARELLEEMGADSAICVDDFRGKKEWLITNRKVSPHDVLRELGFFAYSGEDGDLYRKHGMGGWRVSIYGWGSYRIQQRSKERWDGRNIWTTKKLFRASEEEEFAEFMAKFVESADGKDKYNRAITMLTED